jgi:hypothetical protein
LLCGSKHRQAKRSNHSEQQRTAFAPLRLCVKY